MSTTTVASLLVKISADASGVAKGVDSAEKRVSGFAKYVEGFDSRLRSFGSGMMEGATRISFGINQIRDAAQTVIGPLVGVIQKASDLNESMNKVDVVFGSSSQAIKDFAANSASALGMSSQAALEGLGTFGNLFKAMKISEPVSAQMSKNLVQLATDLASFNNIDPTAALEKLRAGATGEAEPLKSLGILLNETTMKAKLLEMGIKPVNGQFTEAAKVQARYALMLEQSKAAQSDFARTSDGLANSSRIVQAQIENLTTSLGQSFLPYVQQALGYVQGLMRQFDGLSEGTKKLITSVIAIGVGMGVAAVAIGAVATMLGALLSPIGLIVGAVLALGIAWSQNWFGIRDKTKEIIDQLVKFYQTHKESFANLWNAAVQIAQGMMKSLGSVLSGIVSLISGVMKLLNKDWEGGWADIRQAAEHIWNALLQSWQNMNDIFAAIGEAAWEGIKTVWAAAWEGIKNLASQAWEGIKAAFMQGVEASVAFAASLPEKIAHTFGLVIGSAVKFGAEFIAGLVGFFVTLPEKLPGYISTAWEFIKSAFSRGVAFAIQAAQDFYNGIAEWFNKVPDTAEGIFDRLWSIITSWPGKLLQKGIQVGKSLLSGVREGWEQHSPSGFEKDLARIEKAFISFPDTLVKLVAPKIKKGSEAMLEAFQGFTAGVNRFLASVVRNVQVTESELARLAKTSLGRSLKSLTAESEKFEEDMRRIGLVIAATPQVAFEAFDALLSKVKASRQIIQKESAFIKEAFSDAFDGQAMLLKMEAATGFMVADQKIRKAVMEANAEVAERTNKGILDSFLTLISRLESSIGPGLTGIISAFTDGFNDIKEKTLARITDVGEGIVQVIGNLPGKIGAKLQAVTSTFLSWIDRIDGILRGLHKVFDSIPDGLGGLLKSVVDLFRNTSAVVADAVTSTSHGAAKAMENAKVAMSGVGTSTESAAARVAGGTNSMLASLTSLSAGFLAMAGIGGSGAAGGAISGALGAVSALGGIAAIFHASLPALLTGPWGIAAIAGGAILGAIFGRKSDAQKQQEAEQAKQLKLQTEKLKADIAKTMADVQSQMIDVFNKGFDFLSRLPDYTRVPKKAMEAFKRDMMALVKIFVDISKEFKGELIDAAKRLAEGIGPAVDMANAAIGLLDRIGSRTPVAGAAIARAGVELEMLARMLGEMAERIPNQMEKAAKKMGTRLLPAVELFNSSIGGLKEAFDLKALPVGVLDIWASSVEAIIAKTGSMAENFDKFWTKQMAFFAERAGAAMGFFTSGVEAIKSAIDVPRLSTATVEAIFTDLTALMNRAFDFSKSIPAELLNLGASVADKVIPWINILKLLGEAMVPLKDYTSVKAALQVLMADFIEALSMMRFLDDLSVQFKERGESIEKNLLAAVAAMTNGISKFGPSLASLNSVMMGGLSSFTFPNPAANPGGGGAGLSFANSSFSPVAPAFPSIGGGGGTVIHQDNRTFIDGIQINNPELEAAFRRLLAMFNGLPQSASAY